MSEVHRAFAKFYKAERDRCEKAMVDILDILCKTDIDTDEQVDAVMERLEAHWGSDIDRAGEDTGSPDHWLR